MAQSSAKKRSPISLTLRVTLGKLTGIGIGVAVFFSLPVLQPDIDLALQIGMAGWYVIFGAVIAMAGIYTVMPYLKLPLPAILRGALIGFGLNLVLGCLVYQQMMQAFAHYADFQFANSIPIIQLGLEGLIWGALIDLFLTRMAGEGKDLAKNL